jgi:hypothetical protein
MTTIVTDYTYFEYDLDKDPPFVETDYYTLPVPVNEWQKLKGMLSWAESQN